MLRSIQVALKEVRSFLQDKGDLAFGLLLPIAIFALMYGAFGGQSTFQGNAYIVNNDAGGKYSNLLIERLNVADNIIIHDLSTSEAESQLQKSDILLATFIPEDFSANLSAGKTAKLVFKQRGNGGQEGQIVAGMIRSAAEKISIELETLNSVQNAVSEKQLSGDQIQVTVQKYLDVEHSNPTIEVNENLIGSSPDPVKQFLPGIITMFILFSITLNARAIVEERKKGTLERLMTTRLTSGQLFAGKFLSGIFRGLVQSIILLVLAYAVFQIFTPVTFLEAITIALVFAAAASAISLVIAVIVRSENGATWFAVVLTMAMTMLGGTFFAISPGTIWETLSKISINTYANEAINGIISGNGTLLDSGTQLIILVVVTIAGLLISRIFFKVIPGK